MKVNFLFIICNLFMISCASIAYDIIPITPDSKTSGIFLSKDDVNSSSDKSFIVSGHPFLPSFFERKVELSNYCPPLRVVHIRIYRPAFSAIPAWLSAGLLLGQTNMEIICGKIFKKDEFSYEQNM